MTTKTAVRELTATEKRIVEKAVTGMTTLHPKNDAIAKLASKVAVGSVLCAKQAWPALATRRKSAVALAADDRSKTIALLAFEATVLTFAHVIEVRDNLHRATDIALAIDLMTRPAGRDSLPGVLREATVLDILTRAYGQ